MKPIKGSPGINFIMPKTSEIKPKVGWDKTMQGFAIACKKAGVAMNNFMMASIIVKVVCLKHGLTKEERKFYHDNYKPIEHGKKNI